MASFKILPFTNIYWVPGELSLGVKQSGHEADCLPPSDAKVKNEWSYTSASPYAFMACRETTVSLLGTSLEFYLCMAVCSTSRTVLQTEMQNVHVRRWS